MAKKMLIDATHPEETRVVVVDGNKVDEFDFESINKRQIAGNIYLAKVTRVEPSLQAAFVDYGGNRHGFLAFSEIHPDYYQIPVADREALLEAEAAIEAAAENEDEEEAKPAKKSRSRRPSRSRSRRKKSDDETTADETTADGATSAHDATVNEAGSEAPETALANEAGDASATDGAASPEQNDAAPATTEPASLEQSDAETTTELAATTDAPGDVAESSETQAEDAPAAEDPAASTAVAEASEQTTSSAAEAESGEAQAAPETTDAPSDDTPPDDAENTGPRSIAESTGTEEDESVSEPVEDSVEDPAPKPKPRARRSRAKKPAPAAETETAETVAEDVAATAPAPSTDAEPAEAVAAPEAATPAAENAETSEEAPAESASAEMAPAPEKAATEDASTEDSAAQGDATETAAPAGEDDDDDTADNNNRSRAKKDVETVGADSVEEEVRPRKFNHRRYKIQEVIKVRQILLVQVVKEERGNKGAALTTYLSLAGRYCVLMPNTARGGGISRKITNAVDRKKLKTTANELEVPKGMGLIIRTAGAKRTKTEIKRDYEFLLRQWDQVRELTLQSVAPAQIYEEGSLIKRSIRDLYGRDIDSIVVDGDDAYREAKDYMKMLMPSHAKNVQPHREITPLFAKHGVENYLAAMFNPTVQLKSGGYIVIGITEALVAIDVNSGRSTREHSIEETALKTNLEASDEVARQLRLRDLAGLIVIDYIDMEENRNNRAVEKRLKDRLKDDRARIQVGRISAFGLMEMSRQRLRPGMLEATTAPCPHCQGTGIIRSADNIALAILRDVEEEAARRRVSEIKVCAPVEIANYLINQKRTHVAGIEDRYGVSVLVEGDISLVTPDYRIEKVKGAPRPIRNNAPAAITAETAFEDTVEDAEIVEETAPQQQNRAPQHANDADGDDDNGGKKRRRGKRGGRRRRKSEGQVAALDGEGSDNGPMAISDSPLGEVIGGDDDGDHDPIVDTETVQKPKRRRPKRRNKSDNAGEAQTGNEPAPQQEAVAASEGTESNAGEDTPVKAPPPLDEGANATETSEPSAPPAEAPADVAEPVAVTPEAEAQPEPEPVSAADPEPAIAET
ncbi:MAG: Rne/Rng family ribonuclease, partial [Pikeienuella sp.]